MAKKVAQLNKEIDRLREELSAEEPSNLAALEEAKAVRFPCILHFIKMLRRLMFLAVY